MELRAWQETDSFKEDIRDLIKYYNQRKEWQNEKEDNKEINRIKQGHTELKLMKEIMQLEKFTEMSCSF